MADSAIYVLLADDDPLMRRLFGGKLTSCGYEVIYATNGAEAFEMTRKLKPNLVILDMRMPGDEDGFQISQRMKKDPEISSIPIILLTNNDFSPEAEKWVKEVVSDYIHKSADLEEFITRVKKLLPPVS